LSVIHNTLKRLLAQGEIVGLRDGSQQIVAYARRTVPPPPGLDQLAGIPNRFGRTLGEMLKEPEKEK